MTKTINEMLPELLKSLEIKDDDMFESMKDLAETQNVKTFREKLWAHRTVLGIPDSDEYVFSADDHTWFSNTKKEYESHRELIRQKVALKMAMNAIEQQRNNDSSLEKLAEAKEYDDLPERFRSAIAHYNLKPASQKDLFEAIKKQTLKYQQHRLQIQSHIEAAEKKIKAKNTRITAIKSTLDSGTRMIAATIRTNEDAYRIHLEAQIKEAETKLSQLPNQDTPLPEREKEAETYLETISQLKDNIEKSITKQNEAANGAFKPAQVLQINYKNTDDYETYIIRQHDKRPNNIAETRKKLKIDNSASENKTVSVNLTKYEDNEKLAEREYTASYLDPGETQVTVRKEKQNSLPAIFTQDHKGGITYEADNKALELEECKDIAINDAFRVAHDLLVSALLQHKEDGLEKVYLRINGSSPQQTERVHAALLVLITENKLKIKPEHILNLNKQAQKPQVGKWGLTELSSTAGNQSRFIQEKLGVKSNWFNSGYTADPGVNERIQHVKELKEALAKAAPKTAGTPVDKQNIAEGTKFKLGK